jgi:hypothetical protein
MFYHPRSFFHKSWVGCHFFQEIFFDAPVTLKRMLENLSRPRFIGLVSLIPRHLPRHHSLRRKLPASPRLFLKPAHLTWLRYMSVGWFKKMEAVCMSKEVDPLCETPDGQWGSKERSSRNPQPTRRFPNCGVNSNRRPILPQPGRQVRGFHTRENPCHLEILKF